MNLEIKKATPKEFKKIYFDYIKDFPLQERRSYHRMMVILKEKYSELLFLYLYDKIIGYAFLNPSSDGKYMILDYFAIKKEYRSKGYGSIFITKIKKLYPEKIGMFGEIEIIEQAKTEQERITRKRRTLFYQKLGFIVMPQIKLNLWHYDYNLIFLPFSSSIPTDQEILDILYNIYDNVYNKGHHTTKNIPDKAKIKIVN